jgi:prephenate dehydratase
MLFVGPNGSSVERVAEHFSGVSVENILPVLTVESLVSTVNLAPGTVGVLPMEDDIRGEFHNTYYNEDGSEEVITKNEYEFKLTFDDIKNSTYEEPLLYHGFGLYVFVVKDLSP